ncbi:uncharacterized protein CANTADRAFT_90729 [Suhomyces tanzawaensis NRRL Y-17324]|uniref:Structure-specific endonuclease subunit SLX4 n=1 Tax=Suhomyces tanzawaensis NRRL Y-17324 TaxID=984487 RepID=A0A1E4SFT0_9ASCO|nr:uncharacterized protein CANTADRAFT_90729 [Suhomyces tanzawaensis NRRL Y-17324]ODV78379.1 hypothetical protein CANTADRAFT_90729 [Suhomyces tanzawaensis NRRL Y-17324]
MSKRGIDQVYETIDSASSAEATPRKPQPGFILLSGSDLLVEDSPDKEKIDLSPFKTPTRKERVHTFGSPLDGRHVDKEKTSTSSPMGIIESLIADLAREEEIVISSEDESIYSTARSVIPLQQFSIPLSIPYGVKQDRKIRRTSRIEIRDGLTVPDRKLGGVEIRNLGPKKDPIDLENEVPDSEDDEHDCSIIEITVEEDEQEQELAFGAIAGNKNEEYTEANTSVLQVPSSPSLREGDSFSLPNPFVEQERILPDVASFSIKELRAIFELWDMKTPRSKQKMIEIITETGKLVSPDVEWKATDPSGASVAITSIHQNITRLIQLNQLWHDRIISFQPILIEQLQQWLQSMGYNLELDLLEKYCWKQGITSTNQRT